MPVLEIELVGEPGLRKDLGRLLADAAARVLSPDRRGATWVKLGWTQKWHYAENGWDERETPDPVFVRLLVAAWPDETERADTSRRLAEALAPLCDRSPELVHILWEPPAAGRVAFGGRLLPSGSASSTALE
jgi:hypothetical protein